MDGMERQKLTRCVEDIRNYSTIHTFDEAETKQKIVTRILDALRWNMFGEEVKPEYAVGSQWVDYALRVNNENRVFIEVKNPKQSLNNAKHQEQLLVYAFHQGVASAILTNGIKWWFYLPLYPGEWENRRYCVVDIMEDEPETSARLLIELLSKESVRSGEAIRRAESEFKRHKKTQIINQSIPKAWNRIIRERNIPLKELLEINTAQFLDFKPDVEETRLIKELVHRFFDDNQKEWLLPILTEKDPSIEPKKDEEKIEPEHSKANHVFVNDTRFEIKFTYQIIVFVADWLIDQGHLNASECPIKLSRGTKRYLINRLPKHPTGKEFTAKVKLKNGLYIETHASTKRNVQLANSLLKKYDYPEGTLRVSFDYT